MRGFVDRIRNSSVISVNLRKELPVITESGNSFDNNNDVKAKKSASSNSMNSLGRYTILYKTLPLQTCFHLDILFFGIQQTKMKHTIGFKFENL